MEDLQLEKVAVSGPALASILQRLSSASGDTDGLLFGHVTHIVSSALSDDPPFDSASCSDSSSQFVATITGFFCSGTTLSFYDPCGRVDPRRVHSVRANNAYGHLLGWFSGRRKTPPRPSMREFSVTSNLSSQFYMPIRESHNPNPNTTRFPACVFLLFTTPIVDQVIHTHEYRAYQFRQSMQRFHPKSIDVVNIGPAFRGHYEAFSPISPFPALNCELRSSTAMIQDKDEGSLIAIKQAMQDQKEIDASTEGYQVTDLKRLVGIDAANYTGGLEDLYEKMLAKVDSLSTSIEKSSANVQEQENYNRKLRHKIAESHK